MEVMVRLSQDLARATGRSRLTVVLEESATVGDLINRLSAHYPASASQISAAVPVIAGQHTGKDSPLVAGQEVSLLTPVSGGYGSLFHTFPIRQEE